MLHISTRVARQDPISGQEGCNALNKLEPTFHYEDKPSMKSHWNIFYVCINSHTVFVVSSSVGTNQYSDTQFVLN